MTAAPSIAPSTKVLSWAVGSGISELSEFESRRVVINPARRNERRCLSEKGCELDDAPIAAPL